MRERNPFLCKKGFYVTEMNFGDCPGDGYKLLSTTDLRGPFKTLKRAQEVFKSMITKEEWNFGIRGPEHSRENQSYKTIWYPTLAQNSY